MFTLKQFLISKLLRRRGKAAFILSLPRYSHILDVGCGNNSPYNTKTLRPDCIYTGIDIGDYNQSKPLMADHYIVIDSAHFHQAIRQQGVVYDAVICAHNLEHCDKRWETLLAMISVLKPGGFLYLAFPCANSVNFPHRTGTLNYYDDPTHQELPPDLEHCITLLEQNNCVLLYQSASYQPRLLYWLGRVLETFSKHRQKVLPGTWEYYGFETIVWGKKLDTVLPR